MAPHVRFLGHQQRLNNGNLVFEVFVNLTQVLAGNPKLSMGSGPTSHVK